MTRYISLSPPPLINALVPFNIYLSPLRSARVLNDAASLPDP